MQPLQPIANWIDERPVSKLQLLILASSALAMLVDGFDLQALPLAIPTMSRELGISLGSLGLVTSSGIAGLGAGAALFGRLTDRFGRRNILLLSLCIVAISCVATAYCRHLEQLTAVRFLNGAGVGGANVAAFALASDYAPLRHRFMMLMIVGCCIPLGSLAAGLFAPNVIEGLHWQGLFYISALLPALLALVVAALVPDSPHFLHRRGALAQLDAVLARMNPAGKAEGLHSKLDFGAGLAVNSIPAWALVSEEHRKKSLTIWLTHGIGAFTLYLLASWLPVILMNVGWSPASALRGVIALSLGGILGSFTAAYFVDKGHLLGALLIGYGAGILSLLILGVSASDQVLWAVLVFVLGFGVSGNQLILIASSAILYPVGLRATSTGFTVAFARMTAIIAPLVGAMALQANVGSQALMIILAAPMCLQFLAVVWGRTSLGQDTRRPAI